MRVGLDPDVELCRRAAWLYANDERARDGIRFDCFNWEDAANLHRIMTARHPSVPVTFTVVFDWPPRGSRSA